MSGIKSSILKQLEIATPVTEDDVALISAFNAGDQDAGYRLFVKHHKMVLKLILDLTKGKWFDDDCFSAGAVGIFEAARRFKPELGFTFLTYAVPWIRKYVYLEVCNIALPAGGISFSRDFKERMYRSIGFKMMGFTDDEICAKMSVTPELLTSLQEAAYTTSKPTQLTLPNPSSYGGSQAEAVPQPGLPSTRSAEEVVIEKDTLLYFYRVIKNLQDPQSTFILLNVLFADVEGGAEILGFRPNSSRKEQMLALGVNRRQYPVLKSRAFQKLRLALRMDERNIPEKDKLWGTSKVDVT